MNTKPARELAKRANDMYLSHLLFLTKLQIRLIKNNAVPIIKIAKGISPLNWLISAF